MEIQTQQAAQQPVDIDPRVLRKLIEDHARFVYWVLRSRSIPVADLDDAMQDVFLVVARRYPERQRDAGIRSWLYAIVIRVASQRRRKHLRVVAREAVGLPLSHVPTPEEEVAAREALGRVEVFTRSLTPALREAFLLSEVEGLSGARIAELSDTNVNTIYARIRAARAAFRRFFREREETPS